MLLGLPPDRSKSSAYSARLIHEPRTVLRKSCSHLEELTQITVHDSTAGMGYMVLRTLLGNTSNMKKYKLAKLVARDCMISV